MRNPGTLWPRLILGLVWILPVGGVSLAHGETTQVNSGLPGAGEMGTASLKMMGSLVLVIGLIICLFYLLKRLRVPGLSRTRSPVMRVVGTLNLAPKRAVALVEVSNEWYLLGVGAESVTLLSKINEPVGLSDSSSASQENMGGFQALLQRKVRWLREARKGNGKKDE